MSSDAVVKTVAKKLKYYFDIKRLEDGFDLSGVNSPHLDHPPLKSRPTLQYDGLHDRALKHYFSLPEVKVKLTNMAPKKKEGEKKSDGPKKEDKIKRKIKSTMSRHDFRGNMERVGIQALYLHSPYFKPTTYPEYVYVNTPAGKRITSDVTGLTALPKSRKHRNRHLKGGWPLLKSVPTSNVTKGEAARLVNIATKLLVATETVDVILPRPPSPKRGQSAPAPFEKQRPSTAKYTWDIHGRRHLTGKPKAYDDSYDSAYMTRSGSGSSSDHKRKKIVVKKVVRKKEAKPPESLTSSAHSSSSEESDKSDVEDEQDEAETPKQTPKSKTKPKSQRKERSKSPVYRSTVIHVPDTKIQDEVTVSQSTQAGDSVGIQTERFMIKDYDHMEDEVKQGKWVEYQVYVRTGNRIGASTKADVKLTMYGEKGCTKEFLLKESKRHKIKFQKGKEDLFMLAGHHIGRIKKIKIGHDRTELTNAWFLEGVTVYDMEEKRIYDFNCERWLSGHDGDRRTYRVLDVDRDRAFIEAYNDAEKEREKEEYKNSRKMSISSTESDSSYRRKNSSHDHTSLKVKGSEQHYRRREPRHSGSDSDSSETSFTTSSSSTDRTPRPLSPLRKPEQDDFFDKKGSGPTFTFRTETSPMASNDQQQSSSHPADVSVETSSEQGSRSNEEFLSGYKIGLKAAEEEKKNKEKVEEEERKQILRGPTIHESAKSGNLARVQELMQYFPDSKNDRDERGWTPLHIASDQGHIEVVKWLAISNVDLNAETPTGYTSMHLAAMNGHVNCIMVLHALGASVTNQTTDKKTPLHLASMKGHLECVKWLVANRARFDVEDDMGRTPRMVAEDNSNQDVMEFLKVCEEEATDPQSGFALMRKSRTGNGELTPIQEDERSMLSTEDKTPLWQDDKEQNLSQQAYAGSDGEKNIKKNSQEDKKMKRKVYDEQHQKMEETGDSFLDSIRHEFESRPEP